MRIFILLLFCFLSITLSAQDDFNPSKGSVGLHVSNNAIGGFGEYYVKPNTSIWLTAGARINNVQLGYGADTSTFAFPTETEEFKNAQTRFVVRSGVRFYVPFKNPKWTVSYSPFVGFSSRSEPSDAYKAAFAREDLNSIYVESQLRPKAQFLEAGGEVGLRWKFARSFYTQTSFLGYYNLTLLGDDKSKFDLDATWGIGYMF